MAHTHVYPLPPPPPPQTENQSRVMSGIKGILAPFVTISQHYSAHSEIKPVSLQVSGVGWGGVGWGRVGKGWGAGREKAWVY